MTPREEQIKTLRDSAEALRTTVKRAREEAAEWQGMADRAREKADRDEENARVWELLADALDGGQLDDIVVPLGTGSDFFADDTSHRTEGRRAHLVLGKVMDMLPSGFEVHAWTIETLATGETTIKIQHGSGMESDEFVRQCISSAATVLGLSYTETTHAGFVRVEAAGNVDEVRVEVWDHARRAAKDAEQAAKDAEAADDAISASERHEHDQADEAKLDAEGWGQGGVPF